jgi:hypothetical protein
MTEYIKFSVLFFENNIYNQRKVCALLSSVQTTNQELRLSQLLDDGIHIEHDNDMLVNPLSYYIIAPEDLYKIWQTIGTFAYGIMLPIKISSNYTWIYSSQPENNLLHWMKNRTDLRENLLAYIFVEQGDGFDGLLRHQLSLHNGLVVKANSCDLHDIGPDYTRQDSVYGSLTNIAGL